MRLPANLPSTACAKGDWVNSVHVPNIWRLFVTHRSLLLATAVLAISAGPLAAQQDPATMLNVAQRSLVTRTELQTTLDSIDRVLKSGGYSSAFRDSKRAEADAIRERLTDGDLHAGDPLLITVVGDESLSKSYVVSPNRTLILAGTIEIPVKGVLRSEIEPYLAKELTKYLRDPNVRVTPSLRIQLSGSVGHVGFFNVPAGTQLTDVLMNPSAGGGVTSQAVFEKSKILRGDKVVLDPKAFKQALATAKTLDELNLQAGDEISIATKSPTAVMTRVMQVVSAVGGLVFLGVQIF